MFLFIIGVKRVSLSWRLRNIKGYSIKISPNMKKSGEKNGSHMYIEILK
jgi:hypothetical protein